MASEKRHKAKAYWLAIQFDTVLFQFILDNLTNELNGSKAIPVDKCEKGIIGETWVHNKRHYFDFDYYTNKEK